jgi:hypothetical protein
MVAKIINVSPSTIGRELSSNIAKCGKTAGNYIAANAA